MAIFDDQSDRFRFFVREKLDPAHPDTPRRIFATRVPLTDDEATRRFDVIERMEHTRLHEQSDPELRRTMFD